jgi:hypothetical protein
MLNEHRIGGRTYTIWYCTPISLRIICLPVELEPQISFIAGAACVFRSRKAHCDNKRALGSALCLDALAYSCVCSAASKGTKPRIR